MIILKDFEVFILNRDFCYILFTLLGLCLGSFYNVYAFRYPRIIDSNNAKDIISWFNEKKLTLPEEVKKISQPISLSFPASHCYTCKNNLKWYHNIPFFSYLFLGGKCSFCNTSISIQYPIVEVIGGVISFATYFIFIEQGVYVFLLAYIFFMVGYLLLLIDLKTLYLPDELNYGLMWLGFLALSIFGVSIINITIENSIIGAATGYASLWIISNVGKKIKGFEVMGGGDLKLLAAIGAFLGVTGAIFTLFFSPFLGILTYVISKFRKNSNQEIPFGPSLIVASWIYIFYGDRIINSILK